MNVTQSLWWHVDQCTRILGECSGQLTRSHADNTRVSHVSDFGHQRRSQQDVIGGEVPVYDWRLSIMKVEQSTGYIFQDRAFQGEWDVRHVL